MKIGKKNPDTEGFRREPTAAPRDETEERRLKNREPTSVYQLLGKNNR